MATATAKEWDGAVVRTWLEQRIVAARADQAAAERGGRDRRDDCDKATAEEMVCALFRGGKATGDQATFLDALRLLLDRDDYVGRGVYDDTRFDRHVRTYIKKLMKMVKTNSGFDNSLHYQ